ncbi:hypothetical protein [Vibrio sp. 11986-1-5]|uniref:hypothetical protein n=1 Tax=Vibrio sp. 11986-1-5 TaxID=2211215 RepID=UPI000D73E1CF|nr:hypothetical protein [Vibrio sp. 11986-1-5]PXA73464.1 hypothetical protein DMC15_05250 [Vibrio sp. 11986-1-5]
MPSFTPVSSPIFPAGSSLPALDAQITKVSPSSSLLTNQPVNVMVNPSPIAPNSALPTESILASNQDSDSSSERAETIETPEQKFNKKKVNTKSNKYDNKSKAKVHLGACAVGSITLGILAGPLGLIFAAAYINAMCGVMYGGSEFYTGDKTNQAKKEPDLQPKDTPHKTTRNFSVPSSEDGRIPDETDAGREKDQDSKDNVFIFAPVINNDNRTTIHGNVYFFNQNNQKNDSSAEPKSSSNFSQTDKETNTTPTMRGARLISQQEAEQLISHSSVVNTAVENVDDIINQFHGAELIHVDFHDGMNAIVDAPESLRHQILLHHNEIGSHTPTSASYNVQGAEDTGVTRKRLLQSNVSQHHRGADFDAFIGTQIAHSQASARLVADELQEKPVIGATGSHHWQQTEQGSWVLQPNNPAQAQAASAMGSSLQSTPINAPVSEGANDVTNAQTVISTTNNMKRSDHTSVKDSPLAKAALHHRGADFDALIGEQIAHSQVSARLVADELQEKPVIGATGSHRWQQAEQGGWVLQPNNSVQAQTPSAMGGSLQSTPINAPVSDGTDAQTVISTTNNMKRSDHTSVKDSPLAKAALHHRGADFDALISAQIAHSQTSARLGADGVQEKPVIGATGSHRWQQAEQGGWVLQPNNSVQAQTPSAMGGSLQSTPTNAPVSDGTDDVTDVQAPTLTPDYVKRSDRTSTDLKKVINVHLTFDTENSHINLVPTTSQGSQIISEILPPVTPADLSKKISSSWTRVISEDGQVRWVNPFQSADQLVLLTAGPISGLGGNYTKGTWNNLRDIEEHRKNRLNNLQNNLSSKDYKMFNILDGKLAWPLQEANLKIA